MVLKEDISDGGRIRAFRVLVHPYPYGNRPILVYSGMTVGHKHICRFPAVRTGKVQICIDRERGPHEMKGISVYYSK